MTVTSTTNRESYAGAGSTGPYTLPAALIGTDETYIAATRVVDATGVETSLTLNAGSNGFTVDAGVTEITTTEAVASGETLVLTISIPKTQETDYISNDAFPSAVHEAALDKLTLMVQQLGEEQDRTISLAVTSELTDITIPDPGADEYLKWNSTGTDLETFALSTTAGLGNIVDDTSPQLGATLDTNSYNISFDDDTGILDSNGNEQLSFTETASAVNYFTITNSATGAPPTLTAAGSDTNIDLTLAAKGTGSFIFSGTATTAAEIRLQEDTDNGTNYMGIKAPTAITSSTTLTLPDGDGSSGQILTTNGSGVLAWATRGMELISSATANDDASVVFTGLSTAAAYLVILANIRPATDGAFLYLRTSTDGGSTFDTSGAYEYALDTHDASTANSFGGSTGADNIPITGAQGNTVTEIASGTLWIPLPSATAYCTMIHDLQYMTTSGVLTRRSGASVRNNSGDVDAIRFQYSAGNITSGRFYLYELKI